MDKKFRFDFQTTQKIIRKIGFIDSFKGKWESLSREENTYLKELRKIATIQSIGSSTRIEGATLSNEEVATLIENLSVHKLETRDEQEAIGYYETLEWVLENHQSMPLSERTILTLHTLLLKFSEKDNPHRGKYKQLVNKVVATYPGGEQRVIFNTTEPYLVPSEMERLVQWYNAQQAQRSMHPLLSIGGFVYEFLSIHPFQDGNGRLSRLLTSLLLLQNEYDFIQYISFEHQIENTKKRYYQVLMDAQRHRGTEQEIIHLWMLYFLECLEVLVVKLEKKYESFKAVGPYLNSRQREVLAFISQHQPLKVGDVAAGLPQYTIHSLRKDLQYLYQQGAIDRTGKGKGVVYFVLEDDTQ